MKKWLIALTSISALSLTGCSWLPFDWGKTEFEPVISTLQYKPYPFAVKQEIMAVQQVRAEYFGQFVNEEQRQTDFTALLWANNKTIKLSVLTPMHQRLWDIQFNGETIHEERLAPLPEALNAAYLLRDIAAAFWPASNLRAQDKRFDVIEKANERTIVDKKTQVPELSIVYSDGARSDHPWGQIDITNHIEQYRLTIISREAR